MILGYKKKQEKMEKVKEERKRKKIILKGKIARFFKTTDKNKILT